MLGFVLLLGICATLCATVASPYPNRPGQERLSIFDHPTAKLPRLLSCHGHLSHGHLCKNQNCTHWHLGMCNNGRCSCLVMPAVAPTTTTVKPPMPGGK
uniref:Putative secreted protein n=1 Tax=Ixodes scapularis TaxID=6945 RepID=A0A4D5RZ02_IXOSC